MPPALRDQLEPWCAAGVTGAVRVLGRPSGTVYLHRGQIEHAECSLTPGIARMLTASGRVRRGAMRALSGQAAIGTSLVRDGLLTPAELETAGVLALFDAAYFLFGLCSPVRFEPGIRQPWSAADPVRLRTACDEVDRRRRTLAAAWPDEDVDAAVVCPVRRIAGQSVALTALQWEVVTGAGRRRTPLDLAWTLGRDAFAVFLEVRRMVRSGLVVPGRTGGSALCAGLRAARERTAPPASPSTVDIPLPRRKRGATAPVAPVDDSQTVVVPDEVLARLITGLGSW